MNRVRIIPVLLMHKRGLYKTTRFTKPVYIGDPINTVKIFSEKETDEIIVLDIDAGVENREPDFERIAAMTSEAFIPFAYGGGIRNIEQAQQLFYLGVEKIILNTVTHTNPALVTGLAKMAGSQSIVASIDYKRNFFGKDLVFIAKGRQSTRVHPLEYAKKMADYGAGEIILGSIEREGAYTGYDLEMIDTISSAVSIPVVALGGASTFADFKRAIEAGASAVAAGSMFVYQRPHNAVLINYPSETLLKQEIFEKI